MIKEFPWELISFPCHTDERGSLTMASSGPHGLVPFEIKRTYWLHDIQDGGKRGAHATFNGLQLMIPLAGGFMVRLSDGVSSRSFNLKANTAIKKGETDALLIKSGTWRELDHFDPGTVVLILSDTYYGDVDYCRDWTEYLERVRGGC